MIKAYDFSAMEQEQPGLISADYVGRTELTDGPRAARAAIVQYLHDLNPRPAVWDLLSRLVSNADLLTKLRVVSDSRWRNCIIVVTPYEAVVPRNAVTYLDGGCSLEATLGYWARHAETIFVQFAHAPGARLRAG